MAFRNVLPRQLSINGSDLSGSEGVNRTYTLPYSSILSAMDIYKNGIMLHSGNDYSVSGAVITFLIWVDNSDTIGGTYYSYLVNVTSSTLRYATTLQLAAILGIKSDIPSWDVSATPTKETVGVGDGSTTTFYLDHQNVIGDSYILYYGGAETTTTTLTELTHYSLDLTKGKITLTAAGKTLLSTNTIYAEYSYYTNNIFNDSYLTDVLLRAENQVDEKINSPFTDGTVDNPDYPVESEVQNSKGHFDNVYFTSKRPVIDITSSLVSDLAIGATSLTLASGDGIKFPLTGEIIIGIEIISYTGITTDTLTGLTRGVRDSSPVAHTSGDEIHTTIIELSGTGEGTTPTWYAQEHKVDIHCDEDGKIYIYNYSVNNNTVTSENTLLSQQDVANRVKLSYYYGYDTIPQLITRLTLLYAKKMLITDTVGKAVISGRNEFKPELINADDQEIKSIIESYVVVNMGNT
jgi:hypothetical protein